MTNPCILIVDDDAAIIETLEIEIRQAIDDVDLVSVTSFELALERLTEQPEINILILDLYEGGIEKENLAGQAIWEEIWNTRFIPVIIFTAGDPVLEPEPPADNPFVTVVRKGMSSPLKVVQQISDFMPTLESLEAVQAQVDKSIQIVLAKTSPLIWKFLGDHAEERNQILTRSIQRRLAAMVEVSSFGDIPLKSWERYIYPPLEDSLLTGDILFTTKNDPMSPSSYRVVLSPSCDLFPRANGESKISEILVAKCEDMDGFLGSLSSTYNVGPKKMEEKLPRYLNDVHVGGYVALPSFGEQIPQMAANLRSLELLALNQVSIDKNEGKEFVRIASIDSPFREQLVWGYMSISGRPGVPTIDVENWAREILS